MIWLDDTMSTGSSLRDGAKTLLSNYNMEVVGAFFLVDRSSDRKDLQVIENSMNIQLKSSFRVNH